MRKSGPGLKSLLAMAAGAAVLLLAGCSTPCDVRLCAPVTSNTSAPPPPPRYLPPPPPVEDSAVRTAPIDGPDAIAPAANRATSPATGPATGTHGEARAQRIGLILPLRSATLGSASDAVRAGFLAAWERDKVGFDVTVIETGDSPQDTVDTFQGAQAANDIIVGPLARAAVTALADSGAVRKPTIALNHPEVRGRPLPAQMLVIGLSIEDEARQVAEWAAEEHPAGAALIITGSSAWQRRIANSFAARWQQLGHSSTQLVLADTNGYLSEAALAQLRNQIDSAAPALVFTALDPSQAGQVRAAAASALPFYGTSSVNPGADPNAAISDLIGMRMLDLPWEVQPAHPAAMAYPRFNTAGQALDMDRLYALGIDAFRIAREISLRDGAPFRLDGVTGNLSIDFGRGPARFERVQRAAVYQGGGYSLIDTGR